MTLLNYLDKYGNKSFLEYKFNNVDNLILSQLSYLSFSGIVPSLYEKGIRLDEACEKYFQKFSMNDINHSWYLIPKISNLLKRMSDCDRYKDAILYNYVNLIDKHGQFGALCIRLNDDSVYVSYEGTDDTMVGWKEDFEMACSYPVSSQKYAVMYLNRAIKFSDLVVRVGGHSKGGNLAVCAVMNCHFYIRNKIIEIYNDDGPGFLRQQVISSKYKKIAAKIKMFIPKQSIVGILMYHNTNYKVIRSSGFGILAHDVFNWQVNDNDFVYDELSGRSIKLQKNINKYLDKLSVAERRKVVESLFSIFEDNNIKLTSEIKFNKMLDMFKSLVNLDKEVRKEIYELLKIIILK